MHDEEYDSEQFTDVDADLIQEFDRLNASENTSESQVHLHLMDVESGSCDTHPSAVVPLPFGHLPPPNHPLQKRGQPPKVHAGPSAVSDIEQRGPGRPKKPIDPNAPVLEK
ncbi:hypothetical protein SCLCIDRAFT_33600 [Scleroderma citrinum Foug A]|uniref:Uncharacterized protein n=1 Tax=Scleroderma citrinum Foug A TaxID=1036808 RepID=A0A0C2ZEA4_9AGAM|nr:hypothetical protein SCLCIDRAFT_33600 [Scleroderma citrinum Foug A]